MDCYIGHTRQPLRKRFTEHYHERNRSDACRSSILFERYGRDGLEIVLIHELELATLEEARREERRLCEVYHESIVNKVRPFTTQDEKEAERLLYSMAYREDNRDEIRKKSKAYYEANRTIILEKAKNIREAKRLLSLLPTQ